MQYNTQQKRMPLPEYGRSIQNMVDHALTIEDRAERQRCANTIINIMGNMFPHLRDVPDFKHKLWDHLAIMSDFKLDIDYPYEIIRKDNLNTRPEVIPYPSTKIRYRRRSCSSLRARRSSSNRSRARRITRPSYAMVRHLPVAAQLLHILPHLVAAGSSRRFLPAAGRVILLPDLLGRM